MRSAKYKFSNSSGTMEQMNEDPEIDPERQMGEIEKLRYVIYIKIKYFC